MPTREDILADLTAANEEVPYVLNPYMYDFLGNYAASTVVQEFGTWQSALESAGIAFKSKIISDIRRLTEDIHHRPSREEYKRKGQFSISNLEKSFGDWESALESAGSPVFRKGVVVKQDVLDDLRQASETVVGELTVEEYREVGEFSLNTVTRFFSDFETAKEAAGTQSSPLADRDSYICPLCGESFSSATRVGLHAESSHDTGLETDWYKDEYRCPLCADHLEQKEIRIHFSTQHQRIIPESLFAKDQEYEETPEAQETSSRTDSSKEKTIGERLADTDRMLRMSRAFRNIGGNDSLEQGDQVKVSLDGDKRGLRKKRQFDGLEDTIVSVTVTENGTRRFRLDSVDVLFDREDLMLVEKNSLK